MSRPCVIVGRGGPQAEPCTQGETASAEKVAKDEEDARSADDLYGSVCVLRAAIGALERGGSFVAMLGSHATAIRGLTRDHTHLLRGVLMQCDVHLLEAFEQCPRGRASGRLGADNGSPRLLPPRAVAG